MIEQILTNDQASGQSRSLLTLEQVAEKLSVSKGWVRDHATRRHPRLAVVLLGGKRAVLRFRPQDVERFINEHLQAGVTQ
jgi:hypothetical protein